jgi:hypothetical protein
VAFEFDFILASDRPALLALSTMESMATVKAALSSLDYKVHSASNHEDFFFRFGRVQYQVVVVEELFAASTPEENLTLVEFKRMPMGQRRHAVSLLIGERFKTLDPMQAFQESFHAVVNAADLDSIGPVVQQTVADQELFLQTWRETQNRLTRSGT